MNTETEIKLRLSALPKEILSSASWSRPSSMKILQTYYKPDDKTVRSIIDDILKKHLTADEIASVISSASEIRTRSCLDEKQNLKYKLTIKTDGNVTRGETEVSITFYQYNLLSNESILGSINKIRHTMTINNLLSDLHSFVLEIDEYMDNLVGLVTAEVEYDPTHFAHVNVVDAISKFIVDNTSEKISIVDVTLDKSFKNKNLAIKSQIP